MELFYNKDNNSALKCQFTDVKIHTCLSCNLGPKKSFFSPSLLFNLLQYTREVNNSLGDSLILDGYW